MARQGWGRHTTVATGSNDATKQVSVNAWNADLDSDGVLGFTPETIASASTVTPTNSLIKLSGSTSIDTIAITNTNEGDLLWVYTSGSVTLNNTSSPSSDGDIKLSGNANKDLSTTVPTTLIRVSTYWYEYAGGDVTSSSTTTFTNKSIDLTDNTLTGTSLELKTAISDETGSGSLVFATSPTFVTPVLGQPASGNLADCTFPTLNQSTTGSSASCTGNSVTATTATNATNVALTNEATDTTCFPLFTAAATGNENALTNATLTFDSNTANLATTTFTGALAGNASTATTAATVTDGTQAAITTCANLVESGALNAGTITSGFGNFDNGSSTLDTGAITATAVDVAGGDVDNVQNLIHDISVTGLDIDFSEDQLQTYTMATNITITSVNEAAGKSKTIKITTDGSERTFTAFPDWHWVGTEPTVQAASKVGILTLTCFGTADTDVIAAYAVEA